MKRIDSGILLIDKESGFTSRHIGNILSKKLGIKKVGHLGTLDPFATGLLVFAFNEGTKLLPYLEDQKKTYVATFKFGLLTTTLDPTGGIISDEEVTPFTLNQVTKVLANFEGEIIQTPPLTSAIRVEGKRLYEYARENKEVTIPERKVNVYRATLLEYNHPFLKVEFEVGKGTYIRTLGNDIAKALNTVATTVGLVRTGHGEFSLNDAKHMDEVTIDDFIPLTKAISYMPIVELDFFNIMRLKNGLGVVINRNDPYIQIVDNDGVLQAICRYNGNEYVPARGFNL